MAAARWQRHVPRRRRRLLHASVVAWEPVPAFRAFLSWNLARNGLAGRVAVRAAVVADPPGSKQTVGGGTTTATFSTLQQLMYCPAAWDAYVN